MMACELTFKTVYVCTVNFFAHYYFHNKAGNPWHNAGLLFPDLLRIFTSAQRISHKDPVFTNGLEFKELCTGINMHFKADDLFHNWQFFTYQNHELALKIRQSGLEFQRDWFLAHIFIELALDHTLVCENETGVAQLYTDLKSCEPNIWNKFFEKCSLNQTEKWNLGMNRFIENQYIMSYKDTEMVVYALNRIYQRAGIGIFNSKQIDFLIVLLNDFIPELKLNVRELHKLMTLNV